MYGQHNVPLKGGVLIASNHQSYLDPILIGLGIERTVSYMARDTLFKNPIFGGLLGMLNVFPVARGQRDTRALRQAVERLQEGSCLTVFPEGTRSHDGRMGRMQPGALVVAGRAKVPIVPAMVEGAYEAWPRNSLPKFSRVLVAFGKPIWPDEQSRLTRDQLTQRLIDDMKVLQKELQGRRSL